MVKVYVGNLPTTITEQDLRDIYSRYGRILKVELKNTVRPPVFAFIVGPLPSIRPHPMLSHVEVRPCPRLKPPQEYGGENSVEEGGGPPR